jgi:hypothetical protein
MLCITFTKSDKLKKTGTRCDLMKIKDRMMLGLLAGFGGNLVKKGIMTVARHLKWAEHDGSEKGASLVLPAWKIATPRGRIIGNICDFSVAGILGIACVYLLTITGKDRAITKGAFYGEVSWSFLYGLLGRQGVSSITVTSPKTLLSQCAAHISYGMTTAYLITKFGDEGLYDGGLPLSASSLKNQTGKQNDESQK